MQAQSSGFINPTQYSAMTAQISNATSCAQLQAISTQLLDSLSASSEASANNIAALKPILELLTAPTSPDAAISWLSSFITLVLKPMYQPYITYASQQAEQLAEYATLSSAITAKAATFTDCTISIPASGISP